ncbi:MAG: BMP family ABC transporter substrate-binding protein [Clostridia bacterium]|nr:BMP family ABC transporter substrate-binding protein [Clostridia bacterium]
MKKILSLVLVLAMLATTAVMFSSCNSGDDEFKLGVILLHDEKSTYDLNFIEAVNKAAADLGLTEDQVVFKKNIEESNDCYDAACDLVDQGCDVIFADSFGHESYLLKAAKEFPEVQFCHATGTMAHTENLDNFHNAFASIYEGRYLAGVAAGMKLNQMIADGDITAEEAKIGYVGAFTFAEVISGYTSFYLGAKSICPSVTMEVQFTGSWYDEVEEKNAANALIQRNCVLISQHADSMGAPSACEEKNVPNVSYNGSTIATCENTFIVSSKIDWTPYFKLICEKAQKGEAIPVDYTGTISTGSVALTDVNGKVAAPDTQTKIDEVKAKLIAGDIKVFDTDTFTVTVVTEGDNKKNLNATVDENGKLTGYMADVDTDAAFTGDTQVVSDGYFHESEKRAAPYFDVQIDGITLLNAKF